MRLIFKILVIAFLATLPLLGFASIVEGLYSTTIEVPDQSRAQREKGFSLALAQVLIKTTGAKDISSRRGVNDALSQASNYMVKYAYLPRLEHEKTEGDQLPAKSGIPLSVQFAKATIDDLMRKLDLPIWPANRPELLIWVLEQTTSGYRFVEGSDLPRELQHSFQRRGLPIQLPLYDLQDQLALKPVDAWSLNQQKLIDAAKRYGADHWLVLRYSKISNGAVRGSWHLAARSGNFAREGAVLNTLQVESKGAYLQGSADQVVDLFAGKMAYFADADTDLFRLVVENIGSFSAYSQLNDFLGRLQIVNGVKVRSIDGDTIVLDLATEGESRVLLRALNKEPRLSRITQLGDDSPEQALAVAARHSGSVEHYRWQAAR
ncbi:MAG: DUF2066 domain-containing protein [Candidatus Reddybacter sp.]